MGTSLQKQTNPKFQKLNVFEGWEVGEDAPWSHSGNPAVVVPPSSTHDIRVTVTVDNLPTGKEKMWRVILRFMGPGSEAAGITSTATCHWPKLIHMATPSCKGAWKIYSVPRSRGKQDMNTALSQHQIRQVKKLEKLKI